MMDFENVRAALERRGYTVFVATRQEALALTRDWMSRAANVGWGGSETIKALGLRELALELKKEVRDHRTDCDLFLLSANALTADGRIVNIDGTGNRVAASIYGPKLVVYFIGRNKIVAGGIDEALARIHREACPPNCRRLAKKTPCATGKCPWFENGQGCDSPDRICKATVIFDRPPTRTPTTVVLLDEELGF